MSKGAPLGEATGASRGFAAPDPHEATIATHPETHAGHAHEPHLPHGSIWPFWLGTTMAIFGLAVITYGRNLRLQEAGDPSNIAAALIFLAVALAALVAALLGWLRQDFVWWQTNTGTGIGMPRAGTLLFISSEVFIFGALFSSYYTFQRLSDHWPDLDHFPLPLGTTAIFTLFLFSSSATIHVAEKKLRAGDKKGFNNWWLATIVLGAIFLAGQVLEYANLIAEGHTLGSGSQFMTSFYMLTGTHGLHVFGGLIGLIIAYVRSVKGNFDEHRHAYPEAIAMYWHFVDLVWVFVFTVLYIWPVFVLGAH